MYLPLARLMHLLKDHVVNAGEEWPDFDVMLLPPTETALPEASQCHIDLKLSSRAVQVVIIFIAICTTQQASIDGQVS
jgi:hypothetical protein